MSNPAAVRAFNTARTQAYWSYAGIIIPMIGIILGALSRSTLKELHGNTDDEQQRIDDVASAALGGIIVSIVALVLAVVGYGFWYAEFHQAQTDYDRAVEQAQQLYR